MVQKLSNKAGGTCDNQFAKKMASYERSGSQVKMSASTNLTRPSLPSFAACLVVHLGCGV